MHFICKSLLQQNETEREKTWNRSRNPKMFCMHKFNMNFEFTLVWFGFQKEFWLRSELCKRLKLLSNCVWHALSRQLSLFAYFRVPHSMKYASRRCLLHLFRALSPSLSLSLTRPFSLSSTYLCIRAHFFCLCRSAAASVSAAVVVHFNFVCIWQATRCGIQRKFHSFASRSLNMRNSPACHTLCPSSRPPSIHPSASAVCI